MAMFDLFGDTSGLPKTRRSSIPYEIEALTFKESWGAGNGSTSIQCRQTWERSGNWIKDMVGEVSVIKPGSTLQLRRFVPEIIGYSDTRRQFCSIVDQINQGGNPTEGANFSFAGSNWPETLWCRYRAAFEVFPYAVLNDAEVAAIQTAAAGLAGATELYRYVVRTRKTYTREQPIPAGAPAGGFKIVDAAVPANRKFIGQVGFRVVQFADIRMRWVRVPVGWPPPIAYAGGTAENPWPPVANPGSNTALEYARDKFAGTINSGYFDCAAPDGYCFAPGTLLYLGFDDSNRYYDAAGDWVCDVDYFFKWKGGRDAGSLVGGWNHFLDAAGNWKEVSRDGLTSGVKPYASNDFNDLFRYKA